ncbi:MAG: hypothetical protein KAH54_05880 [Candidatus Sabulitectum sp.]|nr:hypothetical protein [Candidatus Sabulitectum sp.]
MSNRTFQPWISLKTVLHLKWLGPFLTIPVLFIASMLIESWLQESGILPYVPVGKRSVFSLWRVVMLTGLVGTPLATMFLSESWNKWKKGRERFTGFFFSSILSVFLLTATAMLLMSLGTLTPLGVSSGIIFQMFFSRCIFVAFWSVTAAAFCSSISSGAGGASLSFGLFSMAFFPGLLGSSISWWFIAPLGNMATTVVSTGTGWNSTIATAAHSLFYLGAGFLILRKLIQSK